jgi:hypothetical protein
MADKIDLEKELIDLQDRLAQADFIVAVCDKPDDGLARLIVKTLKPITIRMDANKNHKRPHVHIDYGKSYHVASYAIDTGERLVGDDRFDREMSLWIGTCRPKLFQAWGLLQDGKDAMPIIYELREPEKSGPTLRDLLR